jgi:hypothetical protein
MSPVLLGCSTGIQRILNTSSSIADPISCVFNGTHAYMGVYSFSCPKSCRNQEIHFAYCYHCSSSMLFVLYVSMQRCCMTSSSIPDHVFNGTHAVNALRMPLFDNSPPCCSSFQHHPPSYSSPIQQCWPRHMKYCTLQFKYKNISAHFNIHAFWNSTKLTLSRVKGPQ